ncbi:MAG: hypothetical protein LW724_01885 [Planctomycetaceae bacterium]|nr:hypothetical protein [Planctomycetaceae bacterium]
MASSLSMRSFTASFAATWLLLAVFVSGFGSGPMQSIARACPQDADKEPADKLDKAVRKIHDDFKEYLEQKKRLVESYEALQASIKQSEADWSRIQNEGVIKQFSAIQSAMNSMQLSNTIGSIGSAPGGNNNPNDFAMRQQLQQQLAVNRMMENMNAFMRSQELQQLGVEAQRTIRARFETIQKVMKVEEDYRQWQAGGNRFFEKYWKFTDPQKEFSTQEYQVALAALQDRDKDNLPAQLAEALLLTNKGDYSQASMDKDRDSKLSMQNSIKIDRTNPYCRWLRARLACKQDQISIAETEWKALTTVPAMQLDAKRALALLYAQRVSKTPSNAGRAVTLASEAHEKQSPPTWYSHYVLAVSLNTAKKKDEAIKHIESAKELASQEQQEKCDKLKEAIEQDQPFEIKL